MISNADLTSRPLTEAPSGALVEELRRLIVPVARLLDAGVMISATNDLAHAMMLGLEGQDRCGGAVCLNSHLSHMNSAASLEASVEGKRSVYLFVFYEAGKEFVTPIMRHLIEVAVSNVRKQDQEEALLGELSSSWENLEAVYEISSDLRAVNTPDDLLQRIMGRAVAIRDGLSSALWIQEGKQLLPYASANAGQLTNKRSDEGLVADAITSRRAIVFNDIELAAAAGPDDSEFKLAKSVALAPIATAQGLNGALVVWSTAGDTRFDSHTINLIQALSLQAAMVIENDRLHKATIEAERLRQEVEIGSKIQQVLLLGQMPETVTGLSVAAYTLASRQIDGDFYEFLQHRDDCMDLIVGDVMGKGIPAALVGAATKSHLLRALNRLLASANGEIPDPAEIINAAHAQISPQLIDCESFTTLCFSRFDLTQRRMTYVDCGHTRTIHFRQSGELAMLQGVNMPLGFSEREFYEQVTVIFEPGDVFLFYSDGLTEAHNFAGELFGEQRLAACVRNNGQLPPDQLVEAVRASVTAFAGGEVFSDDLTCIAVRIATSDALFENNRAQLETTSSLKELTKIRTFVQNVCERIPELRNNEHRGDSLVLAVNEAATNIMRHAYQGREDGKICFVAELLPTQLVFTLNHSGNGFDRASITQPKFDLTREGGFGLFIIEQCFDEVAYLTDESGNHSTRLLKRLKTKE